MMLPDTIEPFSRIEVFMTLDVTFEARISLAIARLSVIVDWFEEVLLIVESCIVESITDEFDDVLFSMMLSLAVELMIAEPFAVTFSSATPIAML